MEENLNKISDVVASCNELIDGKVLFAERNIQKILSAIADNEEVYNLIGECLADFNRDKEFEKAFLVSPAGDCKFVMPKEEAKIIALAFCLLVDINSGRVNFDELIRKFFTFSDENGYNNFMETVIEPFRDLISEAFGYFSSVTTPEAIEEMKNTADEYLISEENSLGKPKYKFVDGENLDRTFDLSKGIATQIYEQLSSERKQTEEISQAKTILNSIIIASDKKDFEMLYPLVIGLKHTLKPIKSVRFLSKELFDVVASQLYCD